LILVSKIWHLPIDKFNMFQDSLFVHSIRAVGYVIAMVRISLNV